MISSVHRRVSGLRKNRFDISVPTSNGISNFSSGFLSKLKNNFEFFRTNKISYSLRLTGFQRIIQIFGFKRKLHLKTSGRFLSDSSLKFSVFYFLINCFPILWFGDTVVSCLILTLRVKKTSKEDKFQYSSVLLEPKRTSLLTSRRQVVPLLNFARLLNLLKQICKLDNFLKSRGFLRHLWWLSCFWQRFFNLWTF